MVDANDKVQVEASANRNQPNMFSTTIAFLDYPPCESAYGKLQRRLIRLIPLPALGTYCSRLALSILSIEHNTSGGRHPYGVVNEE